MRFFAPYPYRSPFHATTPEEETTRAIEHLERVLMHENPKHVAALLIEPVVGSNGVITYPDGYLQALRSLTEKHGILLVCDEVMTGFGRTGAAFASQRYGIVPDMITFAKGVTSGYAPLGGVIARDTLAEPVLSGNASFTHGLTFGGHPVSCAVALANLDVFEREDIVGHVQANAEEFRRTLESLRDLPLVGDVRGDGYFVALELVKDQHDPAAQATRFTPEEREKLVRGFIAPRLFASGLICRADDRVDPVVQFSPVLTCGPDQFAEIETVLRTVLTEAEKCRL